MSAYAYQLELVAQVNADMFENQGDTPPSLVFSLPNDVAASTNAPAALTDSSTHNKYRYVRCEWTRMHNWRLRH